jgi:hypothetical protein
MVPKHHGGNEGVIFPPRVIIPFFLYSTRGFCVLRWADPEDTPFEK